MVLLSYTFGLFKELQWLRVKADKVLVLAHSSQGKLVTFSQK